jgi:hypothetical protein
MPEVSIPAKRGTPEWDHAHQQKPHRCMDFPGQLEEQLILSEREGSSRPSRILPVRAFHSSQRRDVGSNGRWPSLNGQERLTYSQLHSSIF